MSTIADTFTTTDASRNSLTSQIEMLVTRLYPTVVRERRDDDRIAIPVLFRLTPFDADRQLLANQASVVIGKNVSRRGLSFFHEKPIPHRRAVIELVHPGAAGFAAEIDIRWCRFTKPGWYESGGRLIRSHAASPDILDDNLPRLALPVADSAETIANFGTSAPCRI